MSDRSPSAPRYAFTPRLLRPAAAAYYLGMSEGAFREHVAPQLVPLREGAMVLYPREQLDAWVDARGAAAPASAEPPVNPWHLPA